MKTGNKTKKQSNRKSDGTVANITESEALRARKIIDENYEQEFPVPDVAGFAKLVAEKRVKEGSEILDGCLLGKLYEYDIYLSFDEDKKEHVVNPRLTEPSDVSLIDLVKGELACIEADFTDEQIEKAPHLCVKKLDAMILDLTKQVIEHERSKGFCKLTKDHKYYPKTTMQKLGYLAEECGEVLAATGKTIRWGLNSVNPEIPKERQEANRDWLLRELADLKQAIRLVENDIESEADE